MRKKEVIKPLEATEFFERISVSTSRQQDFLTAFEKDIAEIPKFAVGPYFWFIPDNANLTIAATSDNLHELTPFKKNEWKQHYPDLLEPVMPEEDINYFRGAVGILLDITEQLPFDKKTDYRFNIYCRMYNKKKVLRWVMVQFPRIIFNEKGQGLSSLIVVTDLSHFEIVNKPLMTVIDTSNVQHPYYRAVLEQKDLKKIQGTLITRREREILSYIIKGYHTRQIADTLFIAYDTVENHKKNLRKKTNTKTAGELVHFVMTNNLL
jgi:DNA-binding CsgD family transcriptional regulator